MFNFSILIFFCLVGEVEERAYYISQRDFWPGLVEMLKVKERNGFPKLLPELYRLNQIIHDCFAI